VTKTHATYSILSGPPLEVAHDGEPIAVSADEPATCEIHARRGAGRETVAG
jgi:hypothetical protein